MMQMKAKAFTLIELLVVISIIALLIAILLPALGSARASAQSVSCLSMVRQFAVAEQLYADQHDDYLIPVRMADTTGALARWYFFNEVHLLMGRDRNIQLSDGRVQWGAYWDTEFICPEASLAFEQEGTADDGLNRFNIERSYNLNSDLIFRVATPDFEGFRRVTVNNPSAYTRWGDGLHAARQISSSSDDYFGETTGVNPDTGGAAGPAYRHPNESINLSFADGHAESRVRSLVDRSIASDDEWRSLWQYDH